MSSTVTKGFTLIELLIVIGIIAILATTVLLVLNPAQILAETRDTQRLSDLDTVKSAIALAQTSTSSLMIGPSAADTCSAATGIGHPQVAVACTNAAPRNVDGTGWVDVNLSSANVGWTTPPVAALPVDPTNSGSSTYVYRGSNAVNGTFMLVAKLESTKHRDKMANDGGSSNCGGSPVTDTTQPQNNCFYEVGTQFFTEQ